MKLQIKELAEMSGVSVRTLHYYDEIGLLKPAFVDEQNGYRFYDETSIERMQGILFYRELDFSLKVISEILSSPNYDKQKALSKQKHLLTLKKERLERLIRLLENAENGGITMNLKNFDNTEYEKTRKIYEAEAKEKWGDTQAYSDFENKTNAYSKEKWIDVNAGLYSLIIEFAECKKLGAKPSDLSAQKLVKKWQDYISGNYYECTREILSGLGVMYVADERFTYNMDKYEKGTTEFISKAIEFYCGEI